MSKKSNDGKREHATGPVPSPPMMAGRNGGRLRRGGPGRPKGSVSLTEHLRKKVQDPETRRQILDAVVGQALAGNFAMMKLIFDRIDGPVVAPPVQKVEVSCQVFADEGEADDIDERAILAAAREIESRRAMEVGRFPVEAVRRLPENGAADPLQ